MAKRLGSPARHAEPGQGRAHLRRDVTEKPMKPHRRQLTTGLRGEQRQEAVAHEIVQPRAAHGAACDVLRKCGADPGQSPSLP